MEPKIRLKVFSGKWKETKFDSLAKIRRGLTYSPSNITAKGVRVLRSSNINEDTFITSEEDVFVEKGCVNIPLANDGDILITAANGSPRLVGKHAVIETNGSKMVPGGFMVLAMTDEPYFLNTCMSSPWYKKFLKTGVAGGNGTIGNLNKTALCESMLYIPTDKVERDSLASYFQHLDSLIQSTTKKIESLKQVKAASLQSMFPQEGETTPRVRFKGFMGDWERKQFCDLYEPSTVKNRTFGTDKIISVANMYFKLASHISDDEYLKSYNVMRLGDIAFEGNKSKEFAHGRFVENTIGDGIVSHVFVVMKPISEQYDIQFWKYLINYERIMGPVLLRSTKHSTMMTDLVVSDFLKESILVPSYEEQKVIGAFFENLDKQIALQTQRLEKLKQIKSACLDNMFV